MPRSRTVRHTLAGLALLTALAVTGGQPADARVADARGVDVSSHQHPGDQPIDWPQVRAAGISFAFIKTDEGPRTGGRYVNPWFRADWDGARRAGLLVGAYHYARPRRPVAATAASDAQDFVATAGRTSLARAGLPPVLDLEEPGALGPAEITAWARQWLATTEALTGRAPIVYTARWYWDGLAGAAPVLGRHPLWIARYADSPGTLPAGWATWSFWQYSGTGRVPGIPTAVDLNLSCGSATDFTGECRWGRPIG